MLFSLWFRSLWLIYETKPQKTTYTERDLKIGFGLERKSDF